MEEKISAYLKEMFAPIGAILHGSRANGTARAHSDWDIFIFVENKISSNRESHLLEIDGQYLDVVCFQYPMTREDIEYNIAKFAPMAKVLFDTDGKIAALLAEAEEIRLRGIIVTPEVYKEEKDEFDKEATRISDWIDDESGVLYTRIADLWRKSYRLWWLMKKNSYSVSPKIGLEIIKNEDPSYYSLLTTLVSGEENKKKEKAIEKIRMKLFPSE